MGAHACLKITYILVWQWSVSLLLLQTEIVTGHMFCKRGMDESGVRKNQNGGRLKVVWCLYELGYSQK